MNTRIGLPPRPDKPPTEAEVEAMINKGGKPVEQEADPQAVRHINVRLTDETLRRIDALRSRRPRRMGSPKMGISLRDWIVEAILDKLDQDEHEQGT